MTRDYCVVWTIQGGREDRPLDALVTWRGPTLDAAREAVARSFHPEHGGDCDPAVHRLTVDGRVGDLVWRPRYWCAAALACAGQSVDAAVHAAVQADLDALGSDDLEAVVAGLGLVHFRPAGGCDYDESGHPVVCPDCLAAARADAS